MARRTTSKAALNPLAKLNFTLNTIEPMTANQEVFFNSYDTGKQQLLLGYPGTGKTYIALYKALKDIEAGKFRRVVIVRTAVATKDIGFLPGNEAEKGAVYELPYKKIISDLFGRDDAYDILKQHDVIRFMLTSYVRGLTVSSSVLIVDEFQNMTAHEADSIVTRLDDTSRVLFCGDILQRDLTKHNEKNIEKFLRVIEAMPDYFDHHYFDIEDIVRSGLVKGYITAKYLMYKDGF